MALERIEQAVRNREAELNLAGIGITRVPPEIDQLSSLRSLDLSRNPLEALPPEIGKIQSLLNLRVVYCGLNALGPELFQLAGLRELDLHRNKLRDLPREIGQLASLLSVDISENRLTVLPIELFRLSNLKALWTSGNGVAVVPSEIGGCVSLQDLGFSHNRVTVLPREIGRLSSLVRLYLGANQIESLPPEIGQLASLTRLELHHNRLRVLPREIGDLSALEHLSLYNNRLSSLPTELNNLKKLEFLGLRDNPALRLSPSVLGSFEKPASHRSILDLYFKRQSGKTRALNEVKLILVGRGGAGKTSTARALRGLPFRKGEGSTPGIALSDWQMQEVKGEAVTAHVWDFAGQVITHALHQFFFSVRCVYVVVLTGRENSERDDAEYWLRLIKAFGTDDQGQGPPVVVALNKWDAPGCRPRIDSGALTERYPFIRAFVELDCQSKRGVAKLKSVLSAEVARLKWVREPFPSQWDDVRRALTKGRTRRAHLTYAEYRALCAAKGVADEGQQDSLAEILHNLGAALNYRNDPRLREATVLQPEWLTRNVYALVRRAEKQAGVLKQGDVDQVLRTERQEAMRTYLVRIMERFEIAYASKTAAGPWLVPQALADTQPQGVELFREHADATRLRYTYPALPEGLVARAIVRLHEFIEVIKSRRQQWATGAVLVRGDARALLRTEPQDRQVTLTVIGPMKACQQLAGLCQAEMRDIHAEIPGLNPLEETRVGQLWVATATLEADEKRGQVTGVPAGGQGTIEVNPTGAMDAYSKRLARSDDVWKPSVFISYSKSNVPQRKRLESELKILKNEGLLRAQWNDRMIDPGDTWDAAIMGQIDKADVVVILASVAALATDYITEHEIPRALELHEAGTAVVVPVIVEKCRWDKTRLGTLNALPPKGKPLNNWSPQSDGWNSVADGLATVFKKLMEARREVADAGHLVSAGPSR